YYEDYFEDSEDSYETVIKNLGDPHKIAAEIIYTNGIPKGYSPQNAAAGTGGMSVLAFIGILCLAFIPVVIVFSVLVSVIAVIFSVAVSLAAMPVGFFGYGLIGLFINFPFGVAAIGLALFSAVLPLLFFIPMMKLIWLICKCFLRMMNWLFGLSKPKAARI
ncbi:MAG: DUF1700 domain-containing protein, partial [Ruminococcus sp.]|nr:DUF1700 domain-containing protein [Ruminococcus sp.]